MKDILIGAVMVVAYLAGCGILGHWLEGARVRETWDPMDDLAQRLTREGRQILATERRPELWN